jgi:Leucine-rich repeat (LRR) protein
LSHAAKPLHFISRFVVFHILLISSGFVFGRELSCSYDTYSNTLWSTSNQCRLSSVDLSSNFRVQDHSFAGTFSQRQAVTTVYFNNPPKVDFVPKEIFAEFPHLNGIEISGSTLPIITNGLFTKNFNVLQYLHLGTNKIQTIESEAFQYLVKLKWIRLSSNQIQILPFQIFKKNPELIYIDLSSNKINSIDSGFFKNLNKLKFVGFAAGNLCVSQKFGCESSTCSVSQSDLDSGLTTCYSNCKNNMECSLKSGKFDKLSGDYIKDNIEAIVSYGHLDVLIKMNYTDLLVKKGYLNLMVESGFLDSLVAQNYLDLLIQNGHLDLLIVKNYTDLLIEKGY